MHPIKCGQFQWLINENSLPVASDKWYDKIWDDEDMCIKLRWDTLDKEAKRNGNE